MGLSKLRPETAIGDGKSYTPTGGTAYLMIYNAVKSKQKLIHGRLHAGGESCAIGSFWDVNPRCSLNYDLIDEVAAVNDSLPKASPRVRRLHVLRWLRWKLNSVGMPGFAPRKKVVTK
jgi:hypothetical protein